MVKDMADFWNKDVDAFRKKSSQYYLYQGGEMRKLQLRERPLKKP